MADASGERRDTPHSVNVPQPNLQIKTFFDLDKVLLITAVMIVSISNIHIQFKWNIDEFLID